MTSDWFDSLVAWISSHPVAAGAVIFLIAFCDALVVVGMLVPALPLLFAVGTLIGLGHVYGPYAVLCAGLGAFAGDGICYWAGRRYGTHMRTIWPFSRYPQLLDRGEQAFRRHGIKSILIARYVGAIRPFVPAVAGMLHMPSRRYVPISLFASMSWGALFLAPGWLFGASFEAVAAVADRLALVLLALGAVIALAWAIVLYTWRWSASRTDRLLVRAILWTRAHPRLGRYAAAVFDPRKKEPAAMAVLAIWLLLISIAWFWLLAVVVMGGEPLGIDVAVQETMHALRNPLADRLFAGLSSIGDAQGLIPACLAVLAYLVWRRRWLAAGHWMAAIAFGLVLTALLDAVIDMPRPPQAPSGFGFPSITVTMTTIVFGFFAVLIAREFPGRRRVWPYLLGGVVVSLLGFAKLYFGAYWLSDVIGGMLFGIAWLLLLGVAYRRRSERSFWIKPLVVLFYGCYAIAVLWHAPRRVDAVLADFAAPVPQPSITLAQWQAGGWRDLPLQRNPRDHAGGQLLDLQFAGSLQDLHLLLQQSGWREQEQAGWVDLLSLLDAELTPADAKVLPATLETRAESLLMRRDASDGRSTQVVRVWPAPVQLHDGVPLWLAQTDTLVYLRPRGWFSLWRPSGAHAETHQAIRQALSDLPLRDEPAPGLPGNARVLRVDGSRGLPERTPIQDSQRSN